MTNTPGTAHAADNGATALAFDPAAGGASASATDRTVSGLVLPWDKIGHTTAGPLQIRRGGVRLPNDIARLKLYSDHTGTPHHKPVGHCLSWRVEDDGVHMTFHLARTPDGDAALLDITERVRDTFSAELAGIRREGQTVIDSLMTGVALVATPAFRDARVADVQAAYTTTERPNTMGVKDFLLAMMQAGATEAAAREKATQYFSAAEIAAITTEDLDFTPATPEQAPPPPVVDPTVEVPAPTAQASHTQRPAVVPAGLITTAPRELSLSEAIDTIRMVQTGRTGEVAHAALANITATSMVDAIPPGWLGELWAGRTVPRRIIPLMARRDLTSYLLRGYKWKTKPVVAPYEGDKAEIPTGPTAIEPFEAEAVRWAGGHDLDRKFYDFGDRGVIESYWRAMNDSYAAVTDAAAGAFLVASATAAGTADDLVSAMITAQNAIDDGVGVAADYILANPADRLALAGFTATTAPAYLGLLGVNLNSIIWTKAVPAKTVVAGAKAAATHHELGGSPLRIEAEHLSHGGRDAALFGYTALTLNNGAGLVKVTFNAPTAPAGKS